MTGSGTQADPFIISDVDDLQAMANDVEAYYELANDIDASATVGWNDGAGFIPIAIGTNAIYPVPDGDVMDAGSWAIYPDDGIFYDKLIIYDTDTTYIEAQSNDCEVVLSFPLAIPLGAEVESVGITCSAKKMGSGDVSAKPLLRINGVNYLGPEWLAGMYDYWGPSYSSAAFTTNPATGLAWTPDEINGIGANALQGAGIAVLDATPNIRFTRMYLFVKYTAPFKKRLDGKEHTITGLFINDDGEFPYVQGGLFDTIGVGAEVKNVGLKDCDITEAGTFARAAALAAYSHGAVSNCYSTGSIVCHDEAGGLIAENEAEGTITDCYSTCSVVTDDDDAGGLCAVNTGTITRCYATGNVTSNWFAGGLLSSNGTTGVIEKCFATGEVKALTWTWAEAGGFARRNYGRITDCYARGDVTAYYDAGGFVGENRSSGTIENCYSTGLVDTIATGYIGGLAYDNDNVITNSFWDKETSGTEVSDGGTGKTTAQMKTEATFTDAGWDFTIIWDIAPTVNDGYPAFPPVVLPTVTTDPATGRGAIAATINGTLNQDGGEACVCGFEWGLDTGYGTTTPPQSKTTGETFSQVIGGLQPGTTYHFRAFATNSVGTSHGADRSFATALAISKAFALAREEL